MHTQRQQQQHNMQPVHTPVTTRLYLGLGCDRNTPAATIVQAIANALAEVGGSVEQVVGAASISIKQNESGLLEALAQLGKPLRFYPPETLAAVPVPNPSAVVQKYTGTPSVSEACALLLANGGTSPTHFHNLLLEKHKHKGAAAQGGFNATVSIAMQPVSNHDDQKHSGTPMTKTTKGKTQTMTTPYTNDKTNAGDQTHTSGANTAKGSIMLVGIGPGDQANMTLRAKSAIESADVVIGYSTYIKLVADMLDGKEVIRKGMTEELDRAESALAEAKKGKKVALISSGDAGVYGMAGPTFEVLFQIGWTPQDAEVEVEIIPGASAINACAALVGAPLTHDFCSISLSDLLTPWPTIARRLDAAAAADFVVALYNPKSGRRTRQIVEAQRLFLRHRKPDTAVAIVKSAYRKRQAITFTTLADMCEHDIGMLTTVLIGNSNTFIQHGRMVTPRGYSNKYNINDIQTSTGNAPKDKKRRQTAHAGEQAGRSLSTGLLGWLDGLQTRIAAGETIDTLAQEFKLPAAYLRETLQEPAEYVPPKSKNSLNS